MKHTRRRRPVLRRKRSRRGMMALEVAMAIAILMLVAMSAYVVGTIAAGRLYHVIAMMTGSPY